jgi:hypothetical protein
MSTQLITIVTAIFAGGVLNQILNITIFEFVNHKRELNKWKRTEKFHIFYELLENASSSKPPCGLENWPGVIRMLSQKVYLLHRQGHPPQDICDYLEELFVLASRAKKNEIITDELRERLRDITSKLRRAFALSIENDK